MLPKPIYIAWCISAYSPLIVYFGLSTDNIYLKTWFFSISIISIFFMILLGKSYKTHNKNFTTIRYAERVYGDSLAYLIPYLALFFDWEQHLTSFRFLFIILILGYQQGAILFIHPLLKLFGFYIYFVHLTTTQKDYNPYKYPRYLISRHKTPPIGTINCCFINHEWIISFDRS
jgi:hypothetical protein